MHTCTCAFVCWHSLNYELSTLCKVINSSIWFAIMSLGWYIAHIMGSWVRIYRFSCTSVPEDWFNHDKRVDPDEIPHIAAFHLGLHCLPKHPFWDFKYTKGWYCLLLTGPEGIKHFSYSTQLSPKFILLINVKMPTISMINTLSERLKARSLFICRYFSFLSSWNFMLSWVEHEKSLITSGPGPDICWLTNEFEWNSSNTVRMSEKWK